MSDNDKLDNLLQELLMNHAGHIDGAVEIAKQQILSNYISKEVFMEAIGDMEPDLEFDWLEETYMKGARNDLREDIKQKLGIDK